MFTDRVIVQNQASQRCQRRKQTKRLSKAPWPWHTTARPPTAKPQKRSVLVLYNLVSSIRSHLGLLWSSSVKLQSMLTEACRVPSLVQQSWLFSSGRWSLCWMRIAVLPSLSGAVHSCSQSVYGVWLTQQVHNAALTQQLNGVRLGVSSR